MSQQERYKDNDDLDLYEAIIKKFSVDHEEQCIKIDLLKIKEKVMLSGNSFTYKVSKAELKFNSVIYTDIKYGHYTNELSEIYRTAINIDSKLLQKVFATNKSLIPEFKHYYLGIDNGIEYKEVDIVCKDHILFISTEEYVLEDYGKVQIRK